MIITEHDIQNNSRKLLTQAGGRTFRANVGVAYQGSKLKFYTDKKTHKPMLLIESPRRFSTGLPPGFPDVFGYDKNGKLYFIEFKTATGRLKPEQINFHDQITPYGICHGVARSPEDALKIVKEGLVGYGY